MMCARVALISPLVAVSGWQSPAFAQQRKVDVELIFAIDASDSVGHTEFKLQADGLAAALSDPTVHTTIATRASIGQSPSPWSSGPAPDNISSACPGPCWKAPTRPWRRRPRSAPSGNPSPGGVTSISGIIDFARGLFPANEFDETRMVLDISSDGRHNHGAPVGPARASALLDRVTINALAITNEYADLDVYFREQVIGGTDTFAEKANGYADYPRAIRAKLLRELANVPTS